MHPPAARTAHPRFAGLPRRLVAGRWVPVAATRRARLLGLAGLAPEAAGPGLLIPCCRSVHTFGMRFALEVVFLDAELQPLRHTRRTPPNRVVFERRASAVLELVVAG